MAKKRKLTVKQKAFADYYIKTGNATESAKKAGYSEKTARFIGNENLTKPYIKLYIQERLKQIESDRIADAEEVMKYLTLVLRGESESETVVIEGEGEGKSSARRMIKQPDERERLKAAELLGKRYALFTDKIEHSGELPVVIKNDMPKPK